MPTVATSGSKHVNYLWNEELAASMNGNEVAALIYRSNLLGADLRLTNFGGGNTSCKTIEKDPLTGKETNVIWIKGSGGDLGTLTRNGLAGLYLDRLKNLENVYRGRAHEDEMVALFNHCIFDLESKSPSIDTPLHAYLPFKHIDHLHPDAVIAIAASKNGKQITQELFNGTVAWIDWQRPGFDLGMKLRNCAKENPSLKGIILGSHGLFTWGESSRECYINSLGIIEQCAAYIEAQVAKQASVFGGQKVTPLKKASRHQQAALLFPLLRGLCSGNSKKIGHFTDNDAVLEFVNSHDLERLAPMGTSCPDHFLRTKISPMLLDLSPKEDLTKPELVKAKLCAQFAAYRSMYEDYYDRHKHADSPPIRDANPVIILYPGVGIFSFAKDKSTARIASEFYTNAINVMKGAEAISEYTSLPKQEAFNIEYWLLEEAKLQRLPKPKTLVGKIALITGSAGGIGKAIAKKFADEGACIILNDNDENRLNSIEKEFSQQYNKDVYVSTFLDVTSQQSVHEALNASVMNFGGIDILVNCAGLSVSKPLEEHTEEDWDRLYDVLVKGQFLVTQEGLRILRLQKMGGDIINIASKNALVSGPNNSAYGSAKAAQIHLSRLNAAELGKDKIRVNVINPDAVISDSKIWEGEWAAGRARAYGITIEELPEFYAKRTLLNEVILPEDIANACFVLVSGFLDKSTGNILNVDGGVPAAFAR